MLFIPLYQKRLCPDLSTTSYMEVLPRNTIVPIFIVCVLHSAVPEKPLSRPQHHLLHGGPHSQHYRVDSHYLRCSFRCARRNFVQTSAPLPTWRSSLATLSCQYSLSVLSIQVCQKNLCPDLSNTSYSEVFKRNIIVDGGWENWSPYSVCDRFIAGGALLQISSRRCDDPE